MYKAPCGVIFPYKHMHIFRLCVNMAYTWLWAEVFTAFLVGWGGGGVGKTEDGVDAESQGRVNRFPLIRPPAVISTLSPRRRARPARHLGSSHPRRRHQSPLHRHQTQSGGGGPRHVTGTGRHTTVWGQAEGGEECAAALEVMLVVNDSHCNLLSEVVNV